MWAKCGAADTASSCCDGKVGAVGLKGAERSTSTPRVHMAGAGGRVGFVSTIESDSKLGPLVLEGRCVKKEKKE